MDINSALILFDALSQETRLKVIRLLVKAGSDGFSAGTLSEKLDVPHNTMSFHLSHLSHAGIVYSKKEGRSMIYVANFKEIQNLIQFLLRDCCNDEMVNLKKSRKRNCLSVELKNCC